MALCHAQQPAKLHPDVLMTGEVNLAELCMSRNDFVTGGGLTGISDQYYLKLHIRTKVKNREARSLTLRGYEKDAGYEIFRTSDPLKRGKAEVEMIAEPNPREPPHLKNQFPAVTLLPLDTFALPTDLSMVVYLDNPSLVVGEHYLRVAINLEEDDDGGNHFFWTSMEPVRFLVPRDSQLIRNRLSRRVPKDSKGFELACEYINTKESTY